MVAIFPKLCLWRRSLCSNLGGVDPKKLYRATLRRGYDYDNDCVDDVDVDDDDDDDDDDYDDSQGNYDAVTSITLY